MNGKQPLSYIVVARHKKIYKVFLKDLRAVIRRRMNRQRPPVPVFEDPDLTHKESEVSSLSDQMEFEPVDLVFANV